MLSKLFSSRKNLWLFTVIFCEGYVVLASELLAIRLLVPFVGSGAEIISIVISAVLLPLAIGYHMGGGVYTREVARARRKKRKARSLRAILLVNIISAMLVLTFGLSYFVLEVFFTTLSSAGISSTLMKTSFYCAVFLVWPVYVLGQTIPIVSNYFSKNSLSRATGSMLFFSTLGSFLGSVFSTLVLMMVIGVNNTVIVTLAMLFVLVVVIRQKLFSAEVIIAALIMFMAIMFNREGLYEKRNFVSKNAYSNVQIKEAPEQNARLMIMNLSTSSKVGDGNYDRFKYLAFIEDNFIYSYRGDRPLKILVIGAGGFTLGLNDSRNHYDFVDIDPDLKEVSEKHFIKRTLGSNKKSITASARAFLNESKDTYDLVVIDAYTNFLTIPAECTTKEFFEAVKSKLNRNGSVVANIISSPAFGDRFSARIFNTFSSVFPRFTRQVIDRFSPWEQGPQMRNTMYVYTDNEHSADNEIYTDDKNTYSLDKY